jgi:DNA-binding response OmpR family regulator
MIYPMVVHPRILVADDDCDLRQLLRLIFRREGYDVVEAADSAETIARAADAKPTLILLDVMMPDRDGYETCQQLKQDEQTRQVPIILFSGKLGFRYRAEELQLEAEDYITKPISPKALVQRVEAVMHRPRAD